MKIRSRVYANAALNFTKGVVKFKNGEAEVSEELYQEILDRNFPNIYKDGEMPEYKTKMEEKLRADVKEGNKEFMEEINRLKNIIDSLKSEVQRKDGEIISWKEALEKLKEEYNTFKMKMSITPEPKKEAEVTDEKEMLRKDLQGMKKEDLVELAMSEDGGNFTKEEIDGKKKEEIVEMILSKN